MTSHLNFRIYVYILFSLWINSMALQWQQFICNLFCQQARNSGLPSFVLVFSREKGLCWLRLLFAYYYLSIILSIKPPVCHHSLDSAVDAMHSAIWRHYQFIFCTSWLNIVFNVYIDIRYVLCMQWVCSMIRTYPTHTSSNAKYFPIWPVGEPTDISRQSVMLFWVTDVVITFNF